MNTTTGVNTTNSYIVVAIETVYDTVQKPDEMHTLDFDASSLAVYGNLLVLNTLTAGCKNVTSGGIHGKDHDDVVDVNTCLQMSVAD